MKSKTILLALVCFSVTTVHAQTPAPATQCKDHAPVTLTAGMKVVSQWKGDNWWVATIDKINGDYYEVTFSDGEKGIKKAGEVVAHPDVLYVDGVPPCLKAGDKVVSAWQKDSWWKATVDKVSGDIIELTYSDGEKGLHKSKEMVPAPVI